MGENTDFFSTRENIGLTHHFTDKRRDLVRLSDLPNVTQLNSNYNADFLQLIPVFSLYLFQLEVGAFILR